MHHHARFLRATNESPGWTSRFRELVGSIDAVLHDLRGERWRDPDDITSAQRVAGTLHEAGSDGIVYPSVRFPGGECIAVFWTDVVGIPVQGRHYSYHWDGERAVTAVEVTARTTGCRRYRLVGARALVLSSHLVDVNAHVRVALSVVPVKRWGQRPLRKRDIDPEQLVVVERT